MAYRNHKVVCFTPAGRKRTMSILLDNLSRFTDIIDEFQVWLNTDADQIEDTAWLRSLPDMYPWVKLVELPKEQKRLSPKQLNTGLFYTHTVDSETIYIRFDDDVVYIDDDFFTNLLDFRIDNPNYFLVMANIINNAILSWIHQYLGNLPDSQFKVEQPYCMDPVAWRSGPFAKLIHELLIRKIELAQVSDLFFDHADLKDASRFSISCFCFFGKDFAEFNGIVGQRRQGKVRFDEEIWLTEVYPTLHKKMNTICGSALVAHYSFFAQRPYLDSTNILETYRAIGKGKLSESYYDLLDDGSKAKSKSRTMLKVIDLPRVEQIASYAAALEAEKHGYKVVEQQGHVDIEYEGKVVKSILGQMDKTITDQDVDRALANIWLTKHR